MENRDFCFIVFALSCLKWIYRAYHWYIIIQSYIWYNQLNYKIYCIFLTKCFGIMCNVIGKWSRTLRRKESLEWKILTGEIAAWQISTSFRHVGFTLSTKIICTSVSGLVTVCHVVDYDRALTNSFLYCSGLRNIVYVVKLLEKNFVRVFLCSSFKHDSIKLYFVTLWADFSSMIEL